MIPISRWFVPILFSSALTSVHASDHYDATIAPIFRSYCAGCHNAQDIEGEFSLETYASLRDGGDKGDPIKPGQADDSYLIKVIEGRAKPKMPPKDEPQMPVEDLLKLKAWIIDGASGPGQDSSLFDHVVVPELTASSAIAPITALAYSLDGEQRAVARYGRVDVLAAQSSQVLRTLTDLPGKVNAAQFTADGKSLLIATGITGLKGVAQRWNVESGAFEAEFGGHADVLYDAVFSPDEQWVATAGYDRQIRIWNAGDGQLVRTLTAHQGAVFDLAFNPSGTILASASADETVKLWRMRDGLRLDTLSQPQGEQVSVSFTNDGAYVVSAGADKRLHFWQLVSREEPALNPMIHSRFAHESAITSLLCMPDSKHLVTAAADRSLKVWSLPDLIEVHAYDALPDVVSTLASVAQHPLFVAARMDGSLQTYGLISSRLPSLVVSEVETDREAQARQALSLSVEMEPNNAPNEATNLSLPIVVSGTIGSSTDVDLYRFSARAGQRLLLAIDAARSKSALDSKVEVLDLKGRPIEQVRLQATRDSWLTFRGKDSSTSGDFRVHNWEEMELNEYLFVNGEVLKLWLYPRGPDSGFKVYPGAGKRQNYFFTTGLSHPLGQPCYIVSPVAQGVEPVPNGLPVYPIYWENDDDPQRRWGADSQLWFEVPADGDYLARVSDVRGFGGEQDYKYRLTLRECEPSFEMSIGGKDAKVSPGSGKEITFTVERHEGFEGEVRIDLTDLPEGFTVRSPITIEAGQRSAIAVIRAQASAKDPDDAADAAVRVTAQATIGGQEVSERLGNLGNLQLGDPAKVTVEIIASNQVLEIRPGETITARVRAQRNDFAGRIELGNEDSGRNLPHGVYVDNIGLNGLLIVEGQSEREFFITAAPWVVPGTTRHFHLRTTADGTQASAPMELRVVGP